MSTIGDELSSLVPTGYTERPAYGRVPDPITLFDAALLIARDPASGGRLHAEVFAGLIGAFLRDEITRQRRSLVFTLEPPRTRARSEPGQTMADVIASPTRGMWLDRDGRVYRDKDGRISQVRRRTTWTRQEVLETLSQSKNLPNSYSPRLAVDADAAGFNTATEDDRSDTPRSVSEWTPAERKAAYRILAETPLQDWSGYARALIWDRLCITLRDLDHWITARGERRPGFLLHIDPALKPAQPAKKPPADRQSASDVETECEKWLVTLMTVPWSAPKKTRLDQAKEKWSGLTEAEFDRAWSRAAKKTGSDWTRPGRRRRC
jgi:hypothetical protein